MHHANRNEGEPADSGKWMDVTRVLHPAMVQWPDDPPFELVRLARVSGPDTSNLSQIHTSVHAGTHIDAPLHYIPGGTDVSRIPLDVLCGVAVVVDVDEPRDATVQDLERAHIHRHDRVLFRTLNRLLWQKSSFDEHFHAIGVDAARWLTENQCPLVGIDYLSVDRYDRKDTPAHYILLGAGIAIVEGLDLDHVPSGRYEMVALPLKIAGSDGSPARVILRKP